MTASTSILATAPGTTALRRGQRLSAAWLGTAVALTTASQLRFGVPVGPGELMLVAWIGRSLLSVLAGGAMARSRLTGAMVSFWAASFVLMLSGWLVALLIDRAAAGVRDMVAFVLVATTIGLLVLRPHCEATVRAATRTAALVSTGVLAALLAAGVALRGPVGPINPWYFVRYTGWSDNPNQIALAMCAVPFVLAHLRRDVHGTLRRMTYLGMIALAVTIGIATQSDGLALAWAGSTLLALGLWWVRPGAHSRRSYPRDVLLYVLLPLAAIASLALFGGRVITALEGRFESTYAAGDQGSIRVLLWQHALEATSESPVVGLGPGGHSGWDGPFGEMEAHNLVVDWVSMTGGLGVLVLLLLLGWAAACVRHEPALLGGLVAMVTFGGSGFHLRHPLFWLYFVFIASEGLRTRAPLKRGVTGAGAPLELETGHTR